MPLPLILSPVCLDGQAAIKPIYDLMPSFFLFFTSSWFYALPVPSFLFGSRLSLSLLHLGIYVYYYNCCSCTVLYQILLVMATALVRREGAEFCNAVSHNHYVAELVGQCWALERDNRPTISYCLEVVKTN